MKFKNICFFMQNRLLERDIKRFGADTLEARGLNVSFLDLSNVINPEIRLQAPAGMLDSRHNVIIDSLSDFERKIENYSGEDTLFIDIFGGRKETYFIFELLTRKSLPYASFCSNSIPVLQTNPFKGLYRDMLQLKNVFAFRNIKPPDFLLAGGRKYLKRLPSPNSKTKFVWAHTLDYDLCLDFKNNPRNSLVKGKYAVFLDEYLPLHPDYAVGGALENPFRNPADYYDELNSMLSAVEKSLDMQVVVASHPRARYDEVGNKFNGRTIIQSETINLTQNAELVIAHMSTSMNFAVIFNKPIMFLMPQILKNHGFGDFIRSFSNCLGKSPLDSKAVMDRDISKEKSVNSRKYAEYKNNYIKVDGTPDKYFWDIVADNIL